MDRFESLRSIVKEFEIKERFLKNSGIFMSDCEQYVEVPYAPNSRVYLHKPVVVDNEGKEVTYGCEHERESMLKHESCSSPTSSSFSRSSFYVNNSTGLTQNTAQLHIKGPLDESSDFILDSVLDSNKDSMLSEVNGAEPESKNESILPSDEGHQGILPSSAGILNSEPFDMLPSEDFEI